VPLGDLVRLHRACDLIDRDYAMPLDVPALVGRGDLQVAEVCMAVGCTLLGSVSSRFTELVGDSPSAYRARRHDQGAAIPACAAKIHPRPVRNGEANPAPWP
jgi:hypothetical protein